MIYIEKHESDYTAVVKSTSGDVIWSWPEPIAEGPLWYALQALGCHQIDVIEAFAAADPEDAKKLREAADYVIRINRGPQGPARIQEMADDFRQELREKYGEGAEYLQTIQEEQERVLQKYFGPNETARIHGIYKERMSR